MNLKSNNFVTVLNQFSKYLNLLGFSFKYTESQERYSKKNRTESKKTTGMMFQVFENTEKKQIALVLSDDRQLPLRFFAGFSLSNQGFIPIVEIVSDNGSKDYANQINRLALVSLPVFADSVAKALDLLTNLEVELKSKEVNISKLLDKVVDYRNSFSSTSQISKLEYAGIFNNSNGLRGLILTCMGLFNGFEVVKPRYYKGNFRGYSKFNGLSQLRYKIALVNFLVEEILQ